MDRTINIKSAISDLNMALAYLGDLAETDDVDYVEEMINSYIETAKQELNYIKEG